MSHFLHMSINLMRRAINVRAEADRYEAMIDGKPRGMQRYIIAHVNRLNKKADRLESAADGYYADHARIYGAALAQVVP